MPVRSSTSSVLRWPDRPTVQAAFARWVETAAESRSALRAAGYFGSCATGRWGVGSDLDVVLVVDESDEPFQSRAAGWDLTALPVPVDVLVYTQAEWKALLARDDRFARMLVRDAVWELGPPVIDDR
jgi:predicted nucleotidyltransferase